VPAAAQAIDATGRALPRTYRIRLESHATLWRYLIVNPPAEPQAYAGFRVYCFLLEFERVSRCVVFVISIRLTGIERRCKGTVFRDKVSAQASC
jgi:hypothetical protein